MSKQNIYTNQDFSKLPVSNFVLEQKTTSEIEAIALTLNDTHKGLKIYDIELKQEFTWNGSVFNASPVELTKAVDDKILLDIEAQIKLQNLGQPSVFADGLAGSRVNSEKLMNFTNSNGGKINWYFFAPNTLKVSDITSLYYIINKKTARPPFIFIYTKPTGTGDLGSWFKSRITYELGVDASNLGYAQYYTGEPSSNSLELKTIKLVRNFGNQDLFNANFEEEDVLYIGIGTDSGASNNTYNFDLQEFGYEVGSKRYSVEIQTENFDTALQDAGIEGNLLAMNASGLQLQPKELVFIQKSEVAINNAAKALTSVSNELLTDAPIVGVVGGTIAVNNGSTFELIEKGKFSVVGIGTICDTGEEVWFRPFEPVEKWGTTAGNAGNAVRLGYALNNLGTNTNFLIDFDPQWASEVIITSASNTDHKPVIDVNVVDSDTITRKGRYIVGVDAINDFLDKDNQIADYDGSAFTFTIPYQGYKVQIVEGTEIGKIYIYDGIAWVEFSKTTPIATDNYDIQNNYVAGDLIVRNNKIYQANSDIPANTAFEIGTIGETWKKISAIPEWNLVGVYEAGDIVKKDGLFFEANENIPTNTNFIVGVTGATWKTLTGTAEYGESLLPSNVVLNNNNVFTILTANIPSAGTWEIEYSLNVYYSGGGSSDAANFWIANSSDVAVVGSGIGAYSTDNTNSSIVATRKITVTTQEATTFTVQGRRATQLNPAGVNSVTVYGGGGGNTVSNGGASKVSWKKIAGFLPIIDRINDKSQSNYIDIGEVRYQWGTELSGANARNVTFPAAFKNTAYSFTANAESADYSSRTINLGTKATTNILVRVTAGGSGSNTSFQWMAIGLKP